MRVSNLDLIGRKRRARLARTVLGRDMQIVDVEGASFRVRDTGQSGTPVVVVPDPPNVIEHYDGLIGSLAQNRRVLCVDLPSFGFSVPPSGFRFTIDEHVELFARLLGSLDLGPVVWVSSCLPAYVGLRLASRHPNLVAALVCGQAPSWDEELEWARRIDPKRVLSTPVLGQAFVALRKRRVARGWYRVAAAPLQREWMSDLALQKISEGAAYPLASAFQSFFTDAHRVDPPTVPVVFVWGTLDRTHRRTNRASARENAPHAQLVEFTNSAHFPELEETDRFAAVVDEVSRT